MEFGDLAGSRSPGCETRADGVAPQLVEEEATRGAPRQRDLLERCEVRREVTAKVIVDEGELGCEHGARIELDLLLEHEPLEHETGGNVAIADRPGKRIDGDRPDLAGGQRAQDTRRQAQLPDGERRIEVRPCSTGTAAEILVAHPEVDADRLAFVAVDAGLAERRPAPGPDRVRLQLLASPDGPRAPRA